VPDTSTSSRRAVATVGRLLRRRRAGTAQGVVARLAPGMPPTLQLVSDAFANGAPIPRRYAGRGVGDNVAPGFTWSRPPEGTAQLLLVVEDPDAPARRPFVHLVALGDPSAKRAVEGALTLTSPAEPARVGRGRVRFVPGSLGLRGYQGPRALPGHGRHTYGFHLFALDRAIPDTARLRRLDDVIALARGHVLARGEYFGTQER